MTRRVLEGMRVRIILDVPEIGGAELQAALLARYLMDHERCDVEVWTLIGGPVSLRQHLRRMDTPLRELDLTMPTSPAGRVALVLRLAAHLRASRADILLPFMTFPNLVAGLAFRLSGARVCVWNERVGAPDVKATWAMRLAAALTPVFISNSRLGAECLATIYGAPRDRIHVVRNGVALRPPEEGREAWRKKLGVADDAIVACMVANLHQRKDHTTLIRAFGLAMEQWRPRPALLVCAGAPAGDMRRVLTELAAASGVGEEVLFPGSVTDVAGLLSAADICVFSSRFEGTPNGVIECMAMGLPVVATDLPGIRDALGPGAERWLIPPDDPATFADRLLALMRSPELRGAVGSANRSVAAENFTIESMGARTADVIRSALVC